MAMIYVKTRPGRRAYYQGRAIPTDKFTPVTDTPYIRRLIETWDDLELEAGSELPTRSAQRSGTSPPLAPTAPRPTDTE
jgi:hypothetical protein